MSVNSVYVREIAHGDGVNTVFGFPWKFVAAFDLMVYIDDVLQPASTYEVKNPITKDRGEIVFRTAPAVGAVVVIRRADNQQQTRLFKNQENFNAHEVEKAFDKLTLLVQEGFEELRRGALRMQSQSNLDYTIEDLTIDDGMLALDLASKTYKQTSFTQAQVQKVIDEAVRSADYSVKNMRWDDDTLVVSFSDGSAKKDTVSDNVAQIRAQHDDDNRWWLEWSLDGKVWQGVGGTYGGSVHNNLIERDAPDAHPISAISGLQTVLSAKADSDDVYTKTEVDTALLTKADTTTTDTLRNDVDGLGDQVSDIDGKIPGDASTSNQLATKADVSDLETSLAKVAKTGSYNDLSNKPTIPAAQVNSDWNATSGVAQILNKPTLGTMASESASDYTKTSGLAAVATSGSYTDLSDKPTIGNATLTIQKNGTAIDTFSANATSNKTIDIVVPTKTSDITNDSGFITSSALAPYALSADLATVATTGDYDDLSNKPTMPIVGNGTITITQGGVNKGTFTTNQSGDTTIALDSGGGGIGNIDNLTITANANQEIQAVATINANTSAGATNPVFDWVGTLAEYNSQSIESLHPDWVCFITDDESGGASVYTKTEVDTIANGKVNVGHEVIDSQAPTSANNYTWYRKYADGWVEQGGRNNGTLSGNIFSQTLPVQMANTKYYYNILTELDSSDAGNYFARGITQTNPAQLQYYIYFNNAITTNNPRVIWMVCGMAA